MSHKEIAKINLKYILIRDAPGNHKIKPLSKVFFFKGCFMLRRIAVRGCGSFVSPVNDFKAISVFEPESLITATPHFPCPKYMLSFF